MRGLVTILLLLIVLPVLIAMAMDTTMFDKQVAELVTRAERLRSMGVNVTAVINEVNIAIKAYERGEYDLAQYHLNEAERIISELEPIAPSIHFGVLFTKSLLVAAFVSIPIATYLLLPRIYLYVWFKTRKKWVVRAY